jgi:hypothetical protein
MYSPLTITEANFHSNKLFLIGETFHYKKNSLGINLFTYYFNLLLTMINITLEVLSCKCKEYLTHHPLELLGLALDIVLLVVIAASSHL